MIVRFEPATNATSRIYDEETGETLEIVFLPELHARLTVWREHARAVNAEVRAVLGTAHAPRETVGHRHWPRRAR